MRLDASVQHKFNSVSALHYERRAEDFGGHRDRNEKPSICPPPIDQQYWKFAQWLDLSYHPETTEEQAHRAHWRQM